MAMTESSSTCMVESLPDMVVLSLHLTFLECFEYEVFELSGDGVLLVLTTFAGFLYDWSFLPAFML